MENRAHAVAAGLFIVVFCLASLVIFWWFSQDRFSTHQYELITTGSVTGVGVQSAVRYRGMPVGRVESIRIDPQEPRNLLLTINIREDIPLNRSTHASIAYRGVTGMGFIQLDDYGDDRTPLTAEEGRLPRIVLGSGVMDSLSETAVETLHNVNQVAEKLNVLLAGIDTEKIDGILLNLETISVNVNHSTARMPELLDNIAAFASRENAARFSEILAHVGRTSSALAAVISHTEEMVQSVNSVTQQAGAGFLNQTLPRLNALLNVLSNVALKADRLIEDVNAAPQVVITGREIRPPGPGESGFNGDAK